MCWKSPLWIGFQSVVEFEIVFPSVLEFVRAGSPHGILFGFRCMEEAGGTTIYEKVLGFTRMPIGWDSVNCALPSYFVKRLLSAYYFNYFFLHQKGFPHFFEFGDCRVRRDCYNISGDLERPLFRA